MTGKSSNINRRQFLKRAAATAAGLTGFPYIISSSALGEAGAVAPSNRITLGFIGTGKQSHKTLEGAFLNTPGAQVVAVCDVDALKRKRAQDRIEKHYAEQSTKGTFKGCAAYNDFRDLLARSDIDAVIIAAPEHWHGVIVTQTARAGKDIYCEKPLSLTIAEARTMVNAVRRYKRVLQTGSMHRSNQQLRFACELVRNSYIGELKTVKVNFSMEGFAMVPEECYLPAEAIPDYLDWDMWLGPAPWRPYNSQLAPPVSFDGWPNWRSYRDYAGGLMTDWGAHFFDIIQWALGTDDTGPVEIIPPDNKSHKALTYKYANGVTVTREGDIGILFTGTEGRIEAGSGYLRTWPDSLKGKQIGPNDIHLYESNNHYTDWLKCIRTRSRPICDVEIGCRSVTVCHLGNIAYQLGRPLRWDPEKELFVGDCEANRLLSRPMRSPWHL